MANEISVLAGLAYANSASTLGSGTLSSIQIPASFTTYTVTIQGVRFNAGVVSVTTATGGTAIPMGNLGSVGWAAFQNLDACEGINIQSTASALPRTLLMPGERCVFRFTVTTAPFAYATTSAGGTAPTPYLEYFMLEQ